LVCLVVCVAVSQAQQSEETGGSRLADRRANLFRRIQSRRRGQGSEKKKKFSNSDDVIEKRRNLFRKNPLRRRKPVSSTVDNEIRDFQSRTSGRTRTSLRIRPSTTTESPTTTTELTTTTTTESPVETRPQLLKGVSQFGKFSEPSGFRSRNEQIVSISFKKPKTAPTTQPPPPPPTTTRRTTTIRITTPTILLPEITTRRSFFKSKSDRKSALQALLKTANDKPKVEEENEIKLELNINELPTRVKSAIKEMKDDSQPPSRGNSPRRLNTLKERRKRIRTNLGRGRTSQRKPISTRQKVVKPEASFGSFPSRQSTSGRGRTRLSSRPQKVVTEAPEIQQKEIEQPIAPVQIAPITTRIELTEEEIFPEGREKFFADNGIFTTQQDAEAEAARLNNQVLKSLQNRFVNEAPRSQSNFGGQQQQIVDNQFRSSVDSQQQQQQPQIVNNQFRTSVDRQQQQQKPQQIVNNQFSSSFSSQLQAFDAQFGGSVPVSPGAAKLNSRIFSRPSSIAQQTQFAPQQPQQIQFVPQQPRQNQFATQQPQQTQFVPQQPQQNQFAQQQTQFVQQEPRFQSQQPQQSQFQPQQPQFQPQGTQFQSQQQTFSSPIVPASRFLGHPADNINLNTGSFSLQTGK